MVSNHTRRSFLHLAGISLGGLAASEIATATRVTDRYVVDTRRTPADELADFEVIHRLDPVDALVVRASHAEMARSRIRCASDVAFRVTPVVGPRHMVDEGPVSLADLQWDKQAQRIPEAHRITHGERSRVSVIDTGVDPTHPDLVHAINRDLSRNFTDDGGDVTDVGFHGTHVSGIVAADGGPDGVTGTAPGTDLVACRVFSGESALFGDVLAAMVYSVEVSADAANLSLGAYPLPLDDPEVQLLLEITERVAAFAVERGTLLVAAAGNAAANLDEDGAVISLPNEAENVMSISATGPIGFRWDDRVPLARPLDRLRRPAHEPAFYTNFGRIAVDVSAPGGNADQDAIDTGVDWFLDLVLSTVPDGYAWAAGTSMAAPQITGAAALLKSVNSAARPSDVRRYLETTADRTGSPRFHGRGHLAVVPALNAARAIH